MRTARKIGRVGISAVAVLSAALAVGCGAMQDGGGSGSGGGGASAAPSSAPSQSDSAPMSSAPNSDTSSPSEQDGAGQGAAGDSTQAANLCKAADLKITLGKSEGAAGTVYRPLQFTNKSSSSCVIQGYPGVSYVTGGSGRQVGEAAYRVGHKGPAVTLAPGATASTAVGFVQAGNYDAAQCKPVAIRGLRVYPPQETASVFVPASGTGCRGTVPGHQLTVKTIVAGVNGQ